MQAPARKRLTASLTLMMLVLLPISNIWGEEKKPIPFPQIPFAPQTYICYKSSEVLKIDGKADEASWQAAPWTDYFIDIQGPSKPEPRFKTRMKMLWDSTYFYFAAEMEEPDVWAKLTDRDAIIFYDNDFEIFIDPNGDTHSYYELEVNAFSTEWDLFLIRPYRDDGGLNMAIHAWDIAGLKTAVHVDGTLNQPGDTDKGWTVEIAIPWHILKEVAQMPCPPNPYDQWRANFSRVEWKTEVVDGKYEKIINPETGKPYPEDNWVWSPQGVINMHYPEMWGYVQFSEHLAESETYVEFQYPDIEAEWALRLLYYHQYNHHVKTGAYVNDVSTFGMEKYHLEHHHWPPEIHISPRQFEAVLKQKDGQGEIRINQYGRIW